MLLSKEKMTLDMRSAYGDSLVEAGLENPQIVCVGADTTDSLKTKNFGNKFPERFFNVGIAEANLVSVAAGLAMAGKIAFASTYAAFLPGRCLDQIRNAICYPNLDVKTCRFARRSNSWSRWCISSTNRGPCHHASNSKYESPCALRCDFC